MNRDQIFAALGLEDSNSGAYAGGWLDPTGSQILSDPVYHVLETSVLLVHLAYLLCQRHFSDQFGHSFFDNARVDLLFRANSVHIHTQQQDARAREHKETRIPCSLSRSIFHAATLAKFDSAVNLSEYA